MFGLAYRIGSIAEKSIPGRITPSIDAPLKLHMGSVFTVLNGSRGHRIQPTCLEWFDLDSMTEFFDAGVVDAGR